MLVLRCGPSYPIVPTARPASRIVRMHRFELWSASDRAHASFPIASTDARQLAANRALPVSRWPSNRVSMCCIMESS
jgi:hypothetical protein